MTEYTFPQSIPVFEPPEQTKVYRLKAGKSDERAVRALTEFVKLPIEMKRGAWRYDPTTVTYTEGTLELSIHRASGGWRFRDVALWQIDDGVSNLEITDAAAVEMARRHIASAALAENKDLELVEVTRLHVGVANPATRYSEERIIDVAVSFRRVLDRMPVEGPGGRIVLYFDNRGQITGIDKVWREIDIIHRTVEGFRPTRNALDDVAKRWGHKGMGAIEVVDIRLGYFELGFDDVQRYLQPMYIMPLTIRSHARSFATRSEHVVPAAANGMKALGPRRKLIYEPPPSSSRESSAKAE
jgi:hypothetical protein